MIKKTIYLSFLIATVFLGSCGKEFLDTENLTEHNLDNFYSNPEQIQEALAGVYNALIVPKMVNEPTLVANVLSDDMLAGGGSGDVLIRSMEAWEPSEEDAYLSVWKTYYSGIYRANMIIARFDQAKYDDEDQKKQDLGEAYFMRALFYFKLAKMFGGLPLMLDPIQDPNQPRATIDETYAQIASDLKFAIETMPKTPVTAISPSRNGHANVWAAEALMARLYLFYTGYSTNILGVSKSELPLVDGGSISKSDVANWLTDMINNSGHKLNEDPRSNWPYSYLSEVEGVYPYAEKEKLKWAEDGKNLETVFAVKFGAFANWGGAQSWTNRLCLFQGIRGNSMVPFGQGWGMGTVNSQLWGAFGADDIRKKGSIIDVTDPDENCGSYEDSKGFHETGYWNKKYTNIQYDAGSGDGVAGMYYNLYGGQKHYMLWHMQDQVLIRYSDVLLMAAELGIDAQANLDAVRTRAKAPSVPATEENIREERRLELCFEGIRFYDILRYGTVKEDLEKVNIPVNDNGIPGQFVGKYRPETNGLLAIPESQIRLSNGVLTQNPGW